MDIYDVELVNYVLLTIVMTKKTSAGRSNCMLEVALKKKKEKKGRGPVVTIGWFVCPTVSMVTTS